MCLTRFFKHAGLFALCAVCTSLAGAQTNTPLIVKRDAPLHRNAHDQSETLVQLPAQSRVVPQGERQGAWVQVKTERGLSGWMRLFQLGHAPSATATHPTDATWVRGFSSWWGHSTAPSAQKPVATTTIGIRGLEVGDIARAQPNPAAVTQAEGQRVDAAQAQAFARRHALHARAIDPLPDTAPWPRPAAANREVAQ
jgi:hypothetical protein